MGIEVVVVKPLRLLGLSSAEINALSKSKARVILLTDNGCEIAVVIGREERKRLDELTSSRGPQGV